MNTPTTRGRLLIWGTPEIKPLANIPPDALKVRLRLRSDKVVTAFVKFNDRIEQWLIYPEDEQTRACPRWKLGSLLAVNALR
jgi:hypothetical protein